jgi:hypothetical protein
LMADPRLFDVTVTVAFEDGLTDLRKVLADVPEAQVPFAETYENPDLAGSLPSLLEVISHDAQVRSEHGEKVLIAALAKVVAAQQREIEQLKSGASGAFATKARSTKS